jgi:4-hydroxy-4-methyl-2-oxoglutarate aldolase
MRPAIDPLTARFEQLSTAVVYDVLDKLGFPNQAVCSSVKPLDPASRLAGPAFTIVGRSLNDGSDYGSAAFEMFRAIRPGVVLVMGGSGHSVAGPWGENASISAMQAGARGMITDTGTRDSGPIVELGFPVFSGYVSPVFMSGRFAIVGHEEPITLAGQCGGDVDVSPGDFVVADRDGVVIVPNRLIHPVLEGAKQLEDVEEEIRKALRAGEERESVYRRLPKFAHLSAIAQQLKRA